MLDYINTNTFRDFADYVMWSADIKPFTTNILKQDAIIYCKRDYIDVLFQNLQFSSRKYILITHASDYPVTITEFNRKPKCIKKWYAENVKYVHPELIPIPIGLTPNKDIDETPLDLDWFIENIERFKSTPKDKKILYCNWAIVNNVEKRKNVVSQLKNNKLEYIWDYPNFTLEDHENLRKEVELLKEGKSTKQKVSKIIHYHDYLENMAKYQFIVSPPGNGEDCHRTWEALYMGGFPIVIKSPIFDEFRDLPIIQVKNYSEITYDLLYSYLNKEYNYEKLEMQYWKQRMINDLKTVY